MASLLSFLWLYLRFLIRQKGKPLIPSILIWPILDPLAGIGIPYQHNQLNNVPLTVLK
jgi:hypothetical protein